MKILHDGTEVSNETLTKMVNGQRHLLTQSEIDTRSAEEQVTLEQKPMQDWLDKMWESDQEMTRVEEDIIEQIGIENFPQAVQDKYNEKITLRGQKPS